MKKFFEKIHMRKLFEKYLEYFVVKHRLNTIQAVKKDRIKAIEQLEDERFDYVMDQDPRWISDDDTYTALTVLQDTYFDRLFYIEQISENGFFLEERERFYETKLQSIKESLLKNDLFKINETFLFEAAEKYMLCENFSSSRYEMSLCDDKTIKEKLNELFDIYDLDYESKSYNPKSYVQKSKTLYKLTGKLYLELYNYLTTECNLTIDDLPPQDELSHYTSLYDLINFMKQQYLMDVYRPTEIDLLLVDALSPNKEEKNKFEKENTLNQHRLVVGLKNKKSQYYNIIFPRGHIVDNIHAMGLSEFLKSDKEFTYKCFAIFNILESCLYKSDPYPDEFCTKWAVKYKGKYASYNYEKKEILSSDKPCFFIYTEVKSGEIYDSIEMYYTSIMCLFDFLRNEEFDESIFSSFELELINIDTVEFFSEEDAKLSIYLKNVFATNEDGELKENRLNEVEIYFDDF